MNPLDLLKKALSVEWIKLLIVLAIGVTVGVLFYPTKHIEEKVSQKYEQQIASLNEQHSKEIQTLNDKLDKETQDNKQLKVESEQKISELQVKITQLKSHQKQTTYKLVKPDGTIEERTYTESDIDQSTQVVTQIQAEYKQKIDAIETKWEKIHEERVTELVKQFDAKEQQYQHTIASLEKSKTITINEKRFGIEAGYLNDKDYYGHATMDVWGPVFIGVHGEAGPHDSKLGAGIGLRF